MPETAVKKKEEKKKGLMPLADRLGLDEGVTTNTPTATTPPPIHPGQMGNLVDGAMQRRREEQESQGGGSLNTDRSINRAARLGGGKTKGMP